MFPRRICSVDLPYQEPNQKKLTPEFRRWTEEISMEMLAKEGIESWQRWVAETVEQFANHGHRLQFLKWQDQVERRLTARRLLGLSSIVSFYAQETGENRIAGDFDNDFVALVSLVCRGPGPLAAIHLAHLKDVATDEFLPMVFADLQTDFRHMVLENGRFLGLGYTFLWLNARLDENRERLMIAAVSGQF